VTEASWCRARLPWRASLGTVIVGADGGEPVLEGSTAAIWELLDAPRSRSALVTLAQDSYGLDEDATTTALDALAAAGLCRST
jgi:hypothetical protein